MADMQSSETGRTILVVDATRASAKNVCELIEFMDTPSVIAARPSDWRDVLGGRRIEALFIGPTLSDGQVSGVLSELEKIDPNVPVVMMEHAH